MDDINLIYSEIVHLVKYGLSGDRKNLRLLASKIANSVRNTHPQYANELMNEIQSNDIVREFNSAKMRPAYEKPVDIDSRQELIIEEFPVILDVEPILPNLIKERLNLLILEFHKAELLKKRNLLPSKTVLFAGPPGVGKTLAARWLASKLELPLFTLNLSSVMSSYLGRTGNNVSAVLEYAKSCRAILLLDEFDTIAKRRDDSSEIGELKRLVNVLLQNVDHWDTDGLLIAATNHPDLLDPAVWRRFDVVLNFHLPDNLLIKDGIRNFWGEGIEINEWIELLSILLEGKSFSDIHKVIISAKRKEVLEEISMNDILYKLVSELTSGISHEKRIQIAMILNSKKAASQRKISEMLGVSRDTIRAKSRTKGE